MKAFWGQKIKHGNAKAFWGEDKRLAEVTVNTRAVVSRLCHPTAALLVSSSPAAEKDRFQNEQSGTQRIKWHMKAVLLVQNEVGSGEAKHWVCGWDAGLWLSSTTSSFLHQLSTAAQNRTWGTILLQVFSEQKVAVTEILGEERLL